VLQTVNFRHKALRSGAAQLAVLLGVSIMAACSSSGGTSIAPVKTGGSTVTPSPVATKTAAPTATPSAAPSGTFSCSGGTTSIGSAGGSASADATTGFFTETFPAGAFSTTTTVGLGYIPQSSLPAPLTRIAHVDRRGHRLPQFTAGAGNTYVLAFCTAFTGTLTGSASLSASGVVPSSIAVGTQLNIALNSGGTWVDVGTATVGSSGSFTSSIPTSALPNINQPGNYLVYEPPAGSGLAVNLGFALLADDGTATITDGLQFVQVEDPSGNAIPTPTTTFFPLSGGDLDGQALTPDAVEGATVDGGDTVNFFSGLSAHTFTLSPTTINVDAYGGDGDSIATLPSGDEDVVAADDGGALAVISGILAGSPVIADTIPNPDTNGDDECCAGLVLSNDGKVLLARGVTTLNVYSIANTGSHAGSTGTGTTDYTFTLTKQFVQGSAGTAPSPYDEDGRDEMALSPVDSSRAVVTGFSASSTPVVQLLTGLPSAPVITAVPIHIPAGAVHRNVARRDIEPSTHRTPLAVTPTSGTEIFAVTITPDGTTAFVSTNVGIFTFSGVNTGTLAQVGGVYSPTITIPSGTCTLAGATSMGVTPDGKYLIAIPNPAYSGCAVTAGSTDTTQGTGVLLTIPISGDTLGAAPVGQLNNVVTPYNDQIIVH
jgi:hypothetical protein